MMAIPALFGAIGAGAGTAAGAGVLSTISTGLSVVSAGVGVVGSLSRASYESSVAKNNATIAGRNAQEATLNAQKEGQQRGAQASVEIGELLANQSASGLNLGSGSYALARKSQAALAAKDSRIIAEGGAIEARNFQEEAAGFKSSARQSKTAGLFGALESGIGLAQSSVTRAAKTNRATARKYG